MARTDSLRINGGRLWDRIHEIAKIGATAGGGCCRLALTDEDKKGRELFAKWCREAGCDMQIDRLGNMFARRPGRDKNKPPIAMGSHLDTQPHGGKFDGIFGVLAAVEVVQTLAENNIETESPLAVVNWTNEEGSRFAPAMLASGVYAGVFALEFALTRTDAAGKTLREELNRIGYVGEIKCGEYKLGGLLEAHIEQGPILERAGEIIGVVTGGQGQRWYDVIIRGQDAHSGSTPMQGRRDALVAAAELITAVESIAVEFAPDAVGTVGELHAKPNSRNTIPGEVWLAIDLRNPDDKILSEMNSRLQTRAQQIQRARKVEITLDEIWHNPPVKFNTECINAVQTAADALGYANRKMVSGAGHDACQVARRVPTAMIFIPCAGGISHNENESATAADVEAGGNVLLYAAVALAGVSNGSRLIKN